MVKAQGCPGLVAKAGGEVARGANPPDQQSLWASPQQSKKSSWFGVGVGGITLGCPERGSVH
jgi:hypothetical protein